MKAFLRSPARLLLAARCSLLTLCALLALCARPVQAAPALTTNRAPFSLNVKNVTTFDFDSLPLESGTYTFSNAATGLTYGNTNYVGLTNGYGNESWLLGPAYSGGVYSMNGSQNAMGGRHLTTIYPPAGVSAFGFDLAQSNNGPQNTVRITAYQGIVSFPLVTGAGLTTTGQFYGFLSADRTPITRIEIESTVTSGLIPYHLFDNVIYGTFNYVPGVDSVNLGTTPQNTPFRFSLEGHATDMEKDPLTYTIVTPPSHGTLSGTLPNLTYTPSTGYTGTDSFTYKVNDGGQDSSIGTLSITVAAPPTALLYFSAATYSARENVGTTAANGAATISVVRAGATTSAVSVNYATTTGGTATAGTDYKATTGTLSWAAGETGTKSFTVPLIADTLKESEETVNLSLSNPGNGASVDTPATAVLTILDGTISLPLAVTTPANATFIKTFTALSGTAPVGSTKVSVNLSHRNSAGKIEYWGNRSGVWGWAVTPVTMPVVLASSGIWSIKANAPAGTRLPTGALLPPGLYSTQAFSEDGAGHTGHSAPDSFTLDPTVPASSLIQSPLNGAAVNALPAVTGTATDNTGGSGIAKVLLYLYRLNSSGAREYWGLNGTTYAWSTISASLPAVLRTPSALTTTWSVTANLPSGANLPGGAYYLVADAYDRTGNFTHSAAVRFIRSVYTVSGKIVKVGGAPLAGVVITRSGSNTRVATNAAGVYSFPGLTSGTYNLTATLSGYSFTPPIRAVVIGTANVANVNFTGTVQQTYSVSGKVATAAGAGIARVSLSRSGSSVVVLTGSTGTYSFAGVPTGTYTLTPTLTGYSFTPASAQVVVRAANVANINFVAAPATTGGGGDNGTGKILLGGLDVMNADGTGRFQIMDTSRLYEDSSKTGLTLINHPRLSPDGTKICFEGEHNSINGAIYVMKCEPVSPTNQPQVLVPNWHYDDFPVWSPDSRQIAFIADRDYDTTHNYSDVYIVNADGSNLRHITPPTIGLFDSYDNCAWSPDGTRLAVVGGRYLPTTQDDPFTDHRDGIWIINADGSNIVPLLINARGVRNPLQLQSNLRWSPDGKTIIFNASSAINLEYQSDIFSVDANGAHLTNLTNSSTIYDFVVGWSLDGSRIIFNSEIYGGGAFTMKPDGSDIVRIPSTKVGEGIISWERGHIATVPVSTFSLSGKITTITGAGMANVTVARSGSTTTVLTDAQGNFSFAGLASGTYTITPSRTGYAFTPVSRSVTIANANVTAINFAVGQGTGGATYSVAGRVTTSAGAAIAGVSINRTGSSSAVLTDAQGNFTLPNVPTGTQTITPTKSGYQFTPVSRQVGVTGAVSNLAFTGVNASFTVYDSISGHLNTAMDANCIRFDNGDGPGLGIFANFPWGEVNMVSLDPGTGGGYELAAIDDYHDTGAGFRVVIYAPNTPTGTYDGFCSIGDPDEVTNILPPGAEFPAVPNSCRTHYSGMIFFTELTKDRCKGNWRCIAKSTTTSARVKYSGSFDLPIYDAQDSRYQALVSRLSASRSYGAQATSTIKLSSAAAQAATQTVQLTFTGALGAASALDPTHYIVSIPGTNCSVESVSLNGDTVTLHLGTSLISTDKSVRIYYNLLDKNGRKVTGLTTVTAR